MTTRITSAEYESAATIRCAHSWDHHATHIEVSHTHDHDPIEHIVVCAECARLAGLVLCCACVDEALLVHAGAASCEMTPVYAPNELVDGRCAKHIALRLQPALTSDLSSPQARAG